MHFSHALGVNWESQNVHWYACLYMYKASAFIIYYEMNYKLVKKMVALIRLPRDDWIVIWKGKIGKITFRYCETTIIQQTHIVRIVVSSFIISYFARNEYVNNVYSRMCTFCSDLTSGNGQLVALYKYKKWVKQVAKILVYWIYWISIFHIFHALNI